MKHAFLNRTVSEVPALPAPFPGRWLISRASRFMAWTAGIALAVMLAACGGGSSSGGGGGNPFAGTYNGVATGTISAPGLSPQTSTGSIQFVIDARGNVTSDPGIKESGTGKLNGNKFTVTVPGSRFNQPGTTCSGAMLIHGTISGTTITGSLSSSGLTCNGAPVQVSGTFSATRAGTGSVSRAPTVPPVMESLQEAAGSIR